MVTYFCLNKYFIICNQSYEGFLTNQQTAYQSIKILVEDFKANEFKYNFPDYKCNITLLFLND